MTPALRRGLVFLEASEESEDNTYPQITQISLWEHVRKNLRNLRNLRINVSSFRG